jgi:hypothetical protein
MHPTTASKSPVRSSLPESTALNAVFSKVDWHLIPLLLIAYMVAYLDRINIGYAQLQMKQTLPFDDAVYGLGAGIFFIGYFLQSPPRENRRAQDVVAHHGAPGPRCDSHDVRIHVHFNFMWCDSCSALLRQAFSRVSFCISPIGIPRCGAVR